MSTTLDLIRQHIGQARYWHEEGNWRHDEGKSAQGDILNICEYLIKTVEAQQQQIDALREDCDHLARRHIPGMPLA